MSALDLIASDDVEEGFDAGEWNNTSENNVVDLSAIPQTIIASPIMGYGATLARQMTEAQARRILGNIDPDRLFGSCQIAIVHGNVLPHLDVHILLPDGSDVDFIISALGIAKTQLEKLYPTEELPLRPAGSRAHAEAIVDDIRMLNRGELTAFPAFEASREEAIAMVMKAIAQ